MTLARARVFKMPFGKFAGRTLEEIAGTRPGLDYLRWFASKGRSVGKPSASVSRAITFYVEYLDRSGGEHHAM